TGTASSPTPSPVPSWMWATPATDPPKPWPTTSWPAIPPAPDPAAVIAPANASWTTPENGTTLTPPGVDPPASPTSLRCADGTTRSRRTATSTSPRPHQAPSNGPPPPATGAAANPTAPPPCSPTPTTTTPARSRMPTTNPTTDPHPSDGAEPAGPLARRSRSASPHPLGSERGDSGGCAGRSGGGARPHRRSARALPVAGPPGWAGPTGGPARGSGCPAMGVDGHQPGGATAARRRGASGPVRGPPAVSDDPPARFPRPDVAGAALADRGDRSAARA